jgi:hypothetical protein
MKMEANVKAAVNERENQKCPIILCEMKCSESMKKK